MTVIYPSPIFGPVHSRRLGVSLGINLMPADGKLCTFNCIYCECGFNEDFRPRLPRPTREEVRAALEARLQDMQQNGPAPDVLTFAGNGEPTAHPHFPEIIDDTLALRDRYFPKAKVSVLSNSTFIHKPAVFDALERVDNNILKLDTVDEEYIRTLDRPTGHYSVESIIERMKAFRGRCIVQTMFLKGGYLGRDMDNTSDRYVLPYVSQVDEYRLQRKLPPRFILHVGGLTGAKNVEALLQATAPRCSWPFVMAGPYTEEERDALAAKYPQQQIFWLGYVDREELPMLYAAASLFAFPSLMEGFGLPVLEAMAVGTPVVCSNVASLPEVAGNAAYTVDPRNLSQLSQALYTVMNDENLRMQMRTRGLERAQHLSWRRTADTTWMVYESFVEEYQRRRRRRT